ncbi:hypothetical protein QH494_02605 [Sphingomonas sp. AR_OL41]|uniref:hypothetical protein n=1 Tax=Sphingomonas sp. AR_OL41 TaxID=3042729 RepID=UPI0024808965|nr:hypothetical protein [Sphingomonas sp. AR_OL41]MDH7971060.1 hypothetical protein [Sphingomonas sp. AR_OL41]
METTIQELKDRYVRERNIIEAALFRLNDEIDIDQLRETIQREMLEEKARFLIKQQEMIINMLNSGMLDRELKARKG